MKKCASVFIAAIACAMPLAAAAQSPSAGVKPTPAPQSVDTAKLHERSLFHHPGFDREEPARGGGERAAEAGRALTNRPAAPATPQPADDMRAHNLHMTSPHIIFVQSKIDEAQAGVRGLERLAALEREPMSAAYREHARAITTDVRSQLADARQHLEHIRAAVPTIQPTAASTVQNELQQADRALNQARADLDRVDAIGSAAAPVAPPIEPGIQARRFSNWRDLGTALNADLNNAKVAVDHIEHALR